MKQKTNLILATICLLFASFSLPEGLVRNNYPETTKYVSGFIAMVLLIVHGFILFARLDKLEKPKGEKHMMVFNAIFAISIASGLLFFGNIMAGTRMMALGITIAGWVINLIVFLFLEYGETFTALEQKNKSIVYEVNDRRLHT